MLKNLKTGALATVVVALVAFLCWQQQQIASLRAESTALREETKRAATLQAENQKLAAEVKAGIEKSLTDQLEIARLRARAAQQRQLEQELAQLKLDHQKVLRETSRASNALADTQPDNGAAPPPNPTDLLPPGVTDFGVVEFSDRSPTRLQLAAGNECAVTTTVLGDGTLQTVFNAESQVGGVITQEQTTVTLIPGRRMAAIINGVEISLIPALKAK